MRRDPARVARATRSTASAASAATARRSSCSSCARWSRGAEHIGAGLAVDEGDARITRVGALPAPHLARRAAEPGQRAARRDVARRPAADGPGAGRRSTPSASAAGSRSSPGSPAGRRSTAAPRCRGASGSSSTSGTSSTARCARPRDPRADASRCCSAGDGLYKGETGGWRGPLCAPRRSAVRLLTGVGKRYDIVAAFAAARDRSSPPTPTRSRRRSTRRTHRARRPRIDDPGYVPALAASCASEHDVGAVVPLTDLDIEVLARRAPTAGCPRSCPTPRSRARPTTSTRRTCCSQRLGLPSPPTVLPGEPSRVVPGDGQAAPRLGRALDPPRRATRDEADVLRRATSTSR